VRKIGVVLCLAFTVAGCSKDEGAARPVQSADDLPQHDAVAPAPTALDSEPAQRPAPADEPKDPLRSSAEPVDCGPARPDPYGLALEWTRRDGSCQVCEQAPAALPLCSPGERGAAVTSRALEANRGKRVKLQGTLRLSSVVCTKRGGACTCNNQCAATLRLARPGTEAPYVTLTSKAEPMVCGGDEGSLCCPFALDATKRSADVVVSGALVESVAIDLANDAGPQSHLEAERICRLK
jgi:hypothetical protein